MPLTRIIYIKILNKSFFCSFQICYLPLSLAFFSRSFIYASRGSSSSSTKAVMFYTSKTDYFQSWLLYKKQKLWIKLSRFELRLDYCQSWINQIRQNLVWSKIHLNHCGIRNYQSKSFQLKHGFISTQNTIFFLHTYKNTNAKSFNLWPVCFFSTI